MQCQSLVTTADYKFAKHLIERPTQWWRDKTLNLLSLQLGWLIYIGMQHILWLNSCISIVLTPSSNHSRLDSIRKRDSPNRSIRQMATSGVDNRSTAFHIARLRNISRYTWSLWEFADSIDSVDSSNGYIFTIRQVERDFAVCRWLSGLLRKYVDSGSGRNILLVDRSDRHILRLVFESLVRRCFRRAVLPWTT